MSSQVNSNASRKYAFTSTEWISAIGEEMGLHPLPDPLVQKLAEDTSYRLREVLHKCATRLRHSKRRRLTAADVNAVMTNLCSIDPLIGVPEQLPEYVSQANLFVPHERFVDVSQKVNDPPSFSQLNVPFLQEIEIVDSKLLEARNNYARRALKMLFNGSQNTFQVLLNDCATNPNLGGEGVVDKLMSIARSMVISNNAQYTRVSTRTCQLIIAITSNDKALYPYHLNSVDKLTELLLDLLLGQGFVNPNLETLFKDCALKLMLRWPSTLNRSISMMKSVLMSGNEQSYVVKKKTIALELLAGVQPLIFFTEDVPSPLFLLNVLNYATPGSNIWYKIALAICAFVRSDKQPLNYSIIIEHFGDSIVPYFLCNQNIPKINEKANLPIIIKSKIRYVPVRTQIKEEFQDRKFVFPDSTPDLSRREIRFAFAGARPIPSNELRRSNLRAGYLFLRNETRASCALVASRRLLAFKYKKKDFSNAYDLSVAIL